MSTTGGRPSDDDEVVPVLLDPSGGSVVVEATVRTGRSGPGLRLIGGALVAAAVVMAWGLFRQPVSDGTEDQGERSGPAGDAAPAGNSTGDPVDGSGVDGSGTDGNGANGGAANDDAVDAGLADGRETTQVAGPVPLLGEMTGLSLALGRQDRFGVTMLDLDAGGLRQIERVRGAPAGIIGSTLIVGDSGGAIRLVDLANVLAEPEAGTPGPVTNNDGWSSLVAVRDDRFWLELDGVAGPRYRAYGADGKLLDEFDPVVNGLGGLPYFGSVLGSPGLISHPTGGLYRSDGAGWEMIAEGLTLAVGERLALVAQCDRTLDCWLVWYDVETAEVRDLPLPDAGAGGSNISYRIVGSDRWLVRTDWWSGIGQLIDIATGQVVRELRFDMLTGGPLFAHGNISDDGRWLLDVADGMLVVIDLDDGTRWDLGLDVELGSGVFIESVP